MSADDTMQVLKRVRMRMQRTVRVLYMIHCTFRDGFQVSCNVESADSIAKQGWQWMLARGIDHV